MKTKSFLKFSAIILFALGFIACEKSEELSGESSRMKAPGYDDKLAAEYNADFDQVAFAVNRLLEESQDFREIVKAEVGKCFDGDYNVLISQLIVNYSIVVELFVQRNVDILSIVEKYPLIQIAIPVEYEQWDGQGGLPVVFVPYDFDEGETEFVDGYDVNGKNVSFSTEEEPEFPVVVISENERTKVLDRLPTEPASPVNLTVTNTEEGIILDWQQYSDEDMAGYDIYRKGESDEAFVQIASLISSNPVDGKFSFVDGDVLGGEYEYYVVATGNHTTGRFIIAKDDIYTLVQNPKILYSESSNFVSANGASPYGIKLKISYDISNSLKLEWNDYSIGGTYNIYRYRSDQPNNRVHIGTVTSKSFIDRNLDKNYTYKYQVSHSFTLSNIAIFHVSDRSYYQKVQLKECKFGSKQDLQRVECWLLGVPEMRAWYFIGNETYPYQFTKKRLIDFEPKKRKDIYESWCTVNQTFLDPNEINTKGSIVSFFWYEEDVKNGNKSIEASSYYELHYRETNEAPGFSNNVITAPFREIGKISKYDDFICSVNTATSLWYSHPVPRFMWWENENLTYPIIGGNTPISVNGTFKWKIRTIN